MKNAFLILALASILVGCKKDDNTAANTSGSTGNSISTVPSQFTQKVLLETYTGASQPQSTDGFVKMENIMNANLTKAIPVNVHFSDAMEIAQYTSLTNAYSNGNPMTFPSAMVNRTASVGQVILNRTQWQSNFDVAKVKTAKCGLAIESSVSGNIATIIVHSGFNQSLAGNYTINTYLIENNVSGSGLMYDQRNSYNSAAGHPYQGQGDPITSFNHNHVLRKVLSSPMGDIINGSNIVASGKQIFTYTTSRSGFKQNDLDVVSFINKTGSTTTDHEIMNVQKVKIGLTQLWD
ncbi:MAG: Omp28-related outer membrane protein [Bacteroidetes bacterium]|nr:Omp28-related outer membrane protein [Bacteroidota bacterium]